MVFSQKIQKLIDKKLKNCQVIEKIGSGGFSEVYLCNYNNKNYALKIENAKKTDSLVNESKILNKLNGVTGVPKLLFFEKIDYCYVMLIELLGVTLDYFIKNKKNISNSDFYYISYKLICILENLHNNQIIHNDIKPENIIIGDQNNSSEIYLIDYGVSDIYKISRTSKSCNVNLEKDDSNLKYLIGTPKYCSLRASYGKLTSYRDDLECLIYVLIFVKEGYLPWCNLKNIYDLISKLKKIYTIKKTANIVNLTADPILKSLIKYFYTLEVFSSKIDYNKIKLYFLDYFTDKAIDFKSYKLEILSDLKFNKSIRKNRVIRIIFKTNFIDNKKQISSDKNLKKKETKKKDKCDLFITKNININRRHADKHCTYKFSINNLDKFEQDIKSMHTIKDNEDKANKVFIFKVIAFNKFFN